MVLLFMICSTCQKLLWSYSTIRYDPNILRLSSEKILRELFCSAGRCEVEASGVAGQELRRKDVIKSPRRDYLWKKFGYHS